MNVHSVVRITAKKRIPLTIYSHSVSAGVPFPSDDHILGVVELSDMLRVAPTGSYGVYVMGDSMTGAGIEHGDLLIVDCTLGAVSGDIVVAAINGELTVKRYQTERGITYLLAENCKYNRIEIKPDDDFQIVGVIIRMVRDYRPPLRYRFSK